jgi:hypothetical protein
MNQNLPVLPDPREKDQEKINRSIIEALKQLYARTGSLLAVDAEQSIGSLRTLGKGAWQAAAGDHRHTINLPNYATNVEALAGGLKVGDIYILTGTGYLMVVV